LADGEEVKFKKRLRIKSTPGGLGGGSTTTLILVDRKTKKEFLHEIIARSIAC
jgi:hypothetical protein